MQEVQSTMLSHIGYDEATQVLTVRFHNGTTYHYDGLTTDDYKAFAGAESIGKHFATHIKNRFNGLKVA